MNGKYFIVLILLSLLSGLGCKDDSNEKVSSLNDAGVQTGDGGSSGLSCGGDVDCANGLVCVESICRLGCGQMQSCPPDYECVDGRFCSLVSRCTSESDCEDGVCDCQGYCRATPPEPCSTDLQCAVADYCNLCVGGCQARSEQCEPCDNDGACASNALCRLPNGNRAATLSGTRPQGVCLRQCQGSCDLLGPGYDCITDETGQGVCAPTSGECGSLLQCQTDVDCAPAEYCNARGRCQVGCAQDSECMSGTLCQSGRCQPPCALPSDCPTGQICVEGRCGIENGCVTSADCESPETYCDRATSLCVSGCEVDEDCQNAALQCVGGNCRPRGCGGNFQCAFGQVCEQNGQCVDAPGRHCESGCDPQQEDSCGQSAICLTLEDDEGNALGDFCFEGCLEAPNECPQGYQCVEFEQQGGMSGGPQGSYCVRDCTYSPI